MKMRKLLPFIAGAQAAQNDKDAQSEHTRQHIHNNMLAMSDIPTQVNASTKPKGHKFNVHNSILLKEAIKDAIEKAPEPGKYTTLRYVMEEKAYGSGARYDLLPGVGRKSTTYQNSSVNNTMVTDNASDESVLSEKSDQESDMGGDKKNKQKKAKKQKKEQSDVMTGTDANQKYKCILTNQDPRRMKWDIFVICLALWNVFFIPYNVAFRPSIGNTPWFLAFNYFIDIAFFFDIIVNFRTTYFNNDGDEVFVPIEIAKRYIFGGRFFIDLLASVPLDNISKELEIFGLLKLIRLSRLSRIITRLNFRDDVKIIFKVLELIFTLIVLIHCLACFWYYVVENEKDWVPPLDFIDQRTNLYYEGTFKKYFSSVYHAIMMLNGGEVGPRTEIELIFVSVIMLAGAIINANIFGNMAVLIQNMNRKDTKFQEQIDTANTAMKNLKLPPETQRKVKDYMLSTQSTHAQKDELDKFLGMIRPSLKFMVRSHIYSKMIVGNEVFTVLLQKDQEEKKQAINYVAEKLEPTYQQPEDVIIDYGTEGDKMFFIAKGQCSVQERNPKSRKFEQIRTLKSNEHFGEISLIYNCRRTMKIISKKYSILAVISGHKFNKELVVEYPQILNAFKEKIFKMYVDKSKMFLHTMLTNLPYFKGLDQEILHEVIFSFKSESLEKDTKVFEEKQLPIGLYLIQQGQIMLQIRSEESYDFPLARLGKGSFLNYESCIKTKQHQVTALCEKPVTIQFLSKEKLVELSKQHNIISDRLNVHLKQIENNPNKPYPLDYYIPDVVTRVNGIGDKERFRNQIMNGVGGRDAKFKIKNMTVRLVHETRSRKKVEQLRTLIEKEIKKDRLKQKMKETTSPQELNVLQDQIEALMYSNTRESHQNFQNGIQDQSMNRSVSYDPNHIPVQLLNDHRRLGDNIDKILKGLSILSTSLNSMELKMKTLSQLAQQRRPPRNLQVLSSRVGQSRQNSEYVEILSEKNSRRGDLN